MAKTKQKNLYDSFVKERDREERGLNEDNPSKPRVGHTVYVYGYGISEDLLRWDWSESVMVSSQKRTFLQEQLHAVRPDRQRLYGGGEELWVHHLRES